MCNFSLHKILTTSTYDWTIGHNEKAHFAVSLYAISLSLFILAILEQS